MSKHLSEDEIKYIISLNTSKAQEEIHKLTKANKDLQKQNDLVSKTMVDLEAKGKQDSEEFRNLASTSKKLQAEMSVNSSKIREITKNMDINVMTMNQLKKHARELASHLNNVSKATNPEKYAELESRLNKVNGRMAELKNSAKSFSEIAQSDVTAGVFLGDVFSKITEKIGEAIGRFKEFISGSVDMARSADGVTHAFSRMNQPGLLDNLRKATKGTVDDLTLMQAAVKAKDFRIPLQDLGKYLAFAQLKAQQTGQSVDYMTDSIVTGLGRKSPLILDNLGLSAAQISEETQKTGDFMKAVAKIVDTQLANAGQTYISASDKTNKKATELANAQLALGQALLPLSETWEDVYGNMQISIIDIIKWMIEHKKIITSLIIAFTGLATVTALNNIKIKENIILTKSAAVVSALWKSILTTFKGVSLLATAAIANMSNNTTRATAAMKLFNTTCKANIIGVIVTLVVAAAAALYLYSKRISEVSITQQSLNKIHEQAMQKVVEERVKIDALTKIIHDNNAALSVRKSAISALQKIAPDYNAKISKEGKIYGENTKALDIYLKRLKEKALVEGANQVAANLAEQQSKIFLDIYNKQKEINEINKKMNSQVNPGLTVAAGYYNSLILRKSRLQSDIKDLNKQFDDAGNAMTVLFKKFGVGMNSQGSNGGDNLTDSDLTNNFSKSRQDAINKENNSYTSSIDTLKMSLAKKKITQEQYDNDSLRRESAHAAALLSIEQVYYKKAQSLGIKDKKTRDDLLSSQNENVIKAKQQLYERQIDIQKNATDKADKKVLDNFNKSRQKELKFAEDKYTQAVNALKIHLADKSMTQEEYDASIAIYESLQSVNILRIEQDYYKKSQSIAIKDAKTKKELQTTQLADLEKAQKDNNDKKIAAEQAYYDHLSKIKEAAKPEKEDLQTQRDNLLTQRDLELKILEGYYSESLQYEQQYGNDTANVTEAYHTAVINIKKKYADKDFQLIKQSEESKQQILDQYGLVSDTERYKQEMDVLKQHLINKDITEQQYEEISNNKKLDRLKKFLQNWASVSSAGSEAVNGLISAEEANVDAKYDVELEAAKNNTAETERLENEKAQKKLDIEKKYADVKFAISASQIISDTAVSIIETHKSLGGWTPWAIAASILMGVTGAAQLAAANAERNKVKNMTLSGSSSSSSSGTRTTSGLESGGSIDVVRAQDGKFFKNSDYDPMRRGYVDHPTVIVGEGPTGSSKEWVASNAAVENPTISPLLDLLDAHQRAGDIRTFDFNKYMKVYAAGRESGGAITTIQKLLPSSNNDNNVVIQKILTLLQKLNDEGIPASVALTDIDRAQQLRDKSRKIGSK